MDQMAKSYGEGRWVRSIVFTEWGDHLCLQEKACSWFVINERTPSSSLSIRGTVKSFGTNLVRTLKGIQHQRSTNQRMDQHSCWYLVQTHWMPTRSIKASDSGGFRKSVRIRRVCPLL